MRSGIITSSNFDEVSAAARFVVLVAKLLIVDDFESSDGEGELVNHLERLAGVGATKPDQHCLVSDDLPAIS
jgi:hypothetical protein